MSVKGMDERAAAAAEVGAALKRALVATRIYAEGHENVVTMTTAAHDKIVGALQKLAQADSEGRGESDPAVLRFDVAPTALRFEERAILEDGDEREAYAGCLYSDGVQSLRLSAGIERAEVERLLLRWSTALRARFGPDHSFSTALWEDELTHVQLDVLDAVGDDGAAEVDDVVVGMRAALSGQLSLAAPGVLWRLSRVEGVPLPVDLDARAGAERSPIDGPSPREIAQLAASVSAARRGAPLRVVLNSFVALACLPQRDHDEAVALAGRFVRALIAADQLDDLRKAIGRVVEAATSREPPQLAELEAFMGVIVDDVVVDALVAALDRADRRASALALLQFVPKRQVDVLLARVNTPETPDGETALVTLIAQKKPSAAQLTAAFVADDRRGAALFRVGRRLSADDAAAVLVAALDGGEGVARAVFQRIKGAEVAAFRGPLVRALGHADPAVAALALGHLARAHDPAAVEPLRARAAGVDVDAARSAVAALIAIATVDAVRALRALFGSVADKDVRAAIALGLGALGDVESVPALDAEAKRLWSPGPLKDACREALRRIAARRAP